MVRLGTVKGNFMLDMLLRFICKHPPQQSIRRVINGRLCVECLKCGAISHGIAADQSTNPYRVR